MISKEKPKDTFFSWKGLVFALFACFCNVTMVSFLKMVQGISNETVIFFRNVISLIVIFPPLFSGKFSIKTKRLPLHFVRGIAGLSAIYCYFYAVKHLPLTNAILLVNTMPLFIPIVVMCWMRFKISIRRILAIIVGFIGVVLILKPGVDLQHFASIIGVLGGALGAIALVGVRLLSKTEDTECILFYYFTICIIISFFPMVFSWTPILDVGSWIYVFLVGFSAVGFQFFLTKTYTYLPATKAGSLMYMSVVFGGIADWIFWDHVPGWMTIAGSLLIIIGGTTALMDKSNPVKFGRKNL